MARPKKKINDDKMVIRKSKHFDLGYFEGTKEEVIKRIREADVPPEAQLRIRYESDYGDCCDRAVLYFEWDEPETDEEYISRMDAIKQPRVMSDLEKSIRVSKLEDFLKEAIRDHNNLMGKIQQEIRDLEK